MAGNPQDVTIRQILSRGHLRLTLFAIALASLGMTATGLFLFRGYEELNLDLASRSVAFSTEAAVYFGDEAGVREALTTLNGVHSVEHAAVLDANGRLLGTWQRPDDRSSLGLLLDKLLWPRPIEAPIVHDGQRIGTVSVHGNSAGQLAFAGFGILIALGCIGITVFATRMLGRRLEDKVVTPLEHVARIADTVREDRDFSLRVGHSGILEVDRFSREFNELLAELQGWHESMAHENRMLGHQAEHDPLTGLGNRAKFERRLDEMFARARQDQTDFSVLFIDLDRFKDVNDTYGHRIGDLVLCDAARRLASTVRSEDSTFRLGGDEFAMLLDPEVEQLQPHQIAARIEAALLPPVKIDSKTRVKISMSIGIAGYPENGHDAESLLHYADTSMYRKKREIDVQ